jgi:hypothetical protein
MAKTHRGGIIVDSMEYSKNFLASSPFSFTSYVQQGIAYIAYELSLSNADKTSEPLKALRAGDTYF